MADEKKTAFTPGAEPKNGASSAPQKGATEGAPPTPLPSPTLPKGGGAIRSIGEKFSANPATGAGSLSVPIFTSPGRGGFHPELTLQYNSGHGNGPFGVGWNLSVPRITRKTDKGLPRYSDGLLTDSDTFILSGAEDLVPVLTNTGGQWSRTSTPDSTGTYDIVRYRPRVDNLYAYIERWTSRADGTSYWRAVTKDHLTSTYGQTAAARIADPDNPKHIFSWLLETTTDGKGNVIAYGYQAEDQLNLDPSVGPEPSRPIANTYLKTISYGNQTPGGSDWLFQVLFDYGDLNSADPVAGKPVVWPGRSDPFSDFRSTFEVRTYRLCQRVLMVHNFVVELGGATVVRSTEFGYSPDPVATRLMSVTQYGWEKQSGVYTTPLALPTLAMTYSEAVIEPTLHTADAASLAHLPVGVDGKSYQLVDLDGEGLPGVLTQQGGGLFYARPMGNGIFAPPARMSRPSLAPASGTPQLADLDGSGHRFLVQLDRSPAGYFERFGDKWSAFRPFQKKPVGALLDAKVKYVDLDGDGLPDLLKPEGELYRWWPSLGKEGYGPERRTTQPRDERQAPYVVWTDPRQAVLLADMTGDGLSDVVRVTAGSVSYWPNRGYGRFGARVTMKNAPRLGSVADFNPEYVRLADIDGSGTSDLIYLENGVARVWLNQAGNGYGSEQRVPFPSPAGNDVTVTDLLGKGTACLVWSSPLPGNRGSQLRYLDLMSGTKPYLLLSVTNNLGATTTITYQPSTAYYLADRRAGLPWVTKLPFPIQVVATVEVDESVTGTKLVTTYKYHHGHYDGVEREFAGFGMVEQTDAETLVEGTTTFAYTPPKLTKSWFHTGAFFDAQAVSTQYAREYSTDFPQLVPDSLLPPSVPPEQMREAARALRGHVLRQEVYGLDGSPLAGHPYAITESNFQVRWLQPRGNNRYGSFDVIPRESMTVHTERNAADPRIEHDVTTNVDVYGNIVEALHIAYARTDADPGSPQAVTLITDTQVDYTNLVDSADDYRIGLVKESRKYQLTGFTAPVGDAYSFAEAQSLLTGTRTIFEQTRMAYLGEATPVDNSVIALGLVTETRRAVFPDALAQTLYGGLPGAPALTEGGYVDQDGMWWASTGQTAYASGNFYLPQQFTDPFGTISSVDYDNYWLLPIHVHQASQSASYAASYATTTSYTNDYRVLAPSLITDANLNQTQVSFDELGRVWQTWVMGKAGEGVGDDAANPSTVIQYITNVIPAYVIVTKREQHYLTDPTNTKTQIAYSYTDGLGREVLTKKQAQPDSSGNPRWTGTGRTVFDNKGNPVQKFEPYFSANPGYEVVVNGVSDLLTYDPLNRVVRTDHPNGSYSLVVLGELPPGDTLPTDVIPNAWGQVNYDENDTVGDPLNAWYKAYTAVTATADQNDAATKTWAHRYTPTRIHVDPLGRTYLTEQDNGGGALFPTTLTLDIQGNPLIVTDARGAVVATTTFDLLKRSLQVVSPDSGTQTSLPDVAGKPIYEWTANGAQVARTYDPLRRPLAVTVTESTGTRIVERTFYGEPITNGESANLKGKLYRQLDGAGLVTHSAYDFKGNLLTSSRQLAETYDFSQINWPALADLTTIDPTWLPPGMLSESFATTIAYDALNRQTHIEMDRSDGTSDVATPIYNETGLLGGMTVQIASAASAVPYVTSIDYNEKEQRLGIAYGNGVSTAYTYEPTTFRLSTLQTTKSTTGDLQSLSYTYDPVGNITTIEDAAIQTLYVGNSQIKPRTTYTYDAIYRLTYALGREHITQSTPDQTFAPPWQPLPSANDGTAMRNYAETYQYDAVGNFIAMVHAVTNSAGQYQNLWTRTYATDAASNRLLQTILGDGTTATTNYVYDDGVAKRAGNMTTMGATSLAWDYKNRLTKATTSKGTTYFQYDTTGQRVRKTLIPATGNISFTERFYLAGHELYREHTTSPTTASLERRTLDVVDGKRKIALIELLTAGSDGSPSQLDRYQLGNHLGSAVLELDGSATTISYEEYHPYGATAYRAGESVLGTNPKRYAFTGKERDEETGLYYNGARYYACWIARWTSADPAGLADGTNLYQYARGAPTMWTDPQGTSSQPLQLTPPSLLAPTHAPSNPYAQPPLTLAPGFNNSPFTGTPVGQAEELTRHVEPGGRLNPPPGRPAAELPEPLKSGIGTNAVPPKDELARYLSVKGISESDVGGSLLRPVTKNYFTIHDTSSLVSGNSFSDDVNTSAWGPNNLANRAAGKGVHVFVNRLGESRTVTDFARDKGLATKYEINLHRNLGINIELVQPRRLDSHGIDSISPTPGFTDAQYARLALLYVAASSRRGAWLIPTLHGALDYGLSADAHDDPQHFDIGAFASQVQKVLNAIWNTNATPRMGSFPASSKHLG